MADGGQICALFEHRVVQERFLISSMEHTESDFPDKYWNFLGFVRLAGGNILSHSLQRSSGPLEFDTELFEIIPSLNQLIKL